MTPPRLIELACPGCDGRVWTIDSDVRGIDGVRAAFETAGFSITLLQVDDHLARLIDAPARAPHFVLDGR